VQWLHPTRPKRVYQAAAVAWTANMNTGFGSRSATLNLWQTPGRSSDTYKGIEKEVCDFLFIVKDRANLISMKAQEDPDRELKSN
jgi:hypothetical protein